MRFLYFHGKEGLTVANVIDESKPVAETRQMFGRRVIKTSVTHITPENVVDVLLKALSIHALNRSEIDFLWEYYKGKQPILHRQKEVRPEITNRIVENRANEIVSFKVATSVVSLFSMSGRTVARKSLRALPV